MSVLIETSPNVLEIIQQPVEVIEVEKNVTVVLGQTAPVDSVFGRTGVVVATPGDYAIADISGLTTGGGGTNFLADDGTYKAISATGNYDDDEVAEFGTDDDFGLVYSSGLDQFQIISGIVVDTNVRLAILPDGRIGINQTGSMSATLNVTTISTTREGIRIKGQASQSDPLLNIVNSSDTSMFSIAANGVPASPGNFGYSNAEAYGSGATITFNNAFAAGPNSIAHSGSVAVGTGAIASGGNSVAIGYLATANSSGSVLIGNATNSLSLQNVIVIGRDAQPVEANSATLGSSSYPINELYAGKGRPDATPTAWRINGTGGSGIDIAGANLQIAAGKGTGNAASGAIEFQTSDAGASGTTLQSLTTKAILTSE